MRVFITGATGFIGSAVVQEFLAAGYEVVGLARSTEKAKALAATGAQVLLGNLEDLASLRKGAEQSDGVVHLGFNHDFSQIKKNSEMDRLAIETMAGVLRGSRRPLLVTAGVAGLRNDGQYATETDSLPANPAWPRVSEQTALHLAEQGVHASVIRLASSVHGDGPQGFMAGFSTLLIGIALQKGRSAYVGEGENRWQAVHRLDAAQLYRLAFEKGTAGARYHGVADPAVPLKAIATTLGQRLKLPVSSIAPAEAAAHFDWFTGFASLDMPASSEATQRELGWNPTHPGLIADLERAELGNGSYSS